MRRAGVDPRLRAWRRRWVVYGAAVVVTVAAAIGAVRDLTWERVWLAAALSAVSAAALMLPVRFDRAGRRSSLAGAGTVVMGFTLPWSWAVLGVAVSAVVAGFQIRRVLTTPGGMVWGSSWVTLGAAASLAVQQEVAGTAPVTPGMVVLATLAFGVASYLVTGLVKRFVMYRGTFRQTFGVPTAPWVIALSFGAAAGWLAQSSPVHLLFLAVPFGAVVVGGFERATARDQHTRLRGIFELAEQARRQTSVEELEAMLCRRLGEELGARVRLGGAPGNGEIGAAFPGADGGDRWIVAEPRYGPPTWQGEYRADEEQLVALIAAVGAATAESIRLADHVRHEAYHDPLTGLPNRRLFDDALQRRAAEAERHGRPFAVLVVDIDHFKRINDQLGHVHADQVLVEVGRRLRAACRDGDVVARWGGEEFIVLADLPDPSDLAEVAHRLHQSLRGPCRVEGQEVMVTASVGAAAWTGAGDCAKELLRAADDAVFRAKRTGRDRFELALTAVGLTRR